MNLVNKLSYSLLALSIGCSTATVNNNSYSLRKFSKGIIMEGEIPLISGDKLTYQYFSKKDNFYSEWCIIKGNKNTLNIKRLDNYFLQMVDNQLGSTSVSKQYYHDKNKKCVKYFFNKENNQNPYNHFIVKNYSDLFKKKKHGCENSKLRLKNIYCRDD